MGMKEVRAIAVGYHGVVRQVDEVFEVAEGEVAAWWEDVVQAVEGKGPRVEALKPVEPTDPETLSQAQALSAPPVPPTLSPSGEVGHPGPLVPDEAYLGTVLPAPGTEPHVIPHPLDEADPQA